MSLEAIVRASGDAMGRVRDVFGVDVSAGLGVMPMSEPSPLLAASASGSGKATSAAHNGATALAGHVSALGEHDRAANSGLKSALAAQTAGRDQMDAVIGAALGDITGLAGATLTPAGQRALVKALARRLEQTWQTLTNGNSCACTCAASSAQTAAAFSGLGGFPVGGVTPTAAMSPMATMAPMAAMSTMPMMAANQAALCSAQAQPNQQNQQQERLPFSDGVRDTHASATTRPGARQSPIPVNAVQYHRGGFQGGRAAVEQYIRQTLNHMGITNLKARNNWFHGLLVGIERESGFRPGAANGWDSNAVGGLRADGFPARSSRGLMQTIPTTFAGHHQPGTSNNIYNPIANIAAGMNYLMSRYHVARDGSNLRWVPQFNPNVAGHGY